MKEVDKLPSMTVIIPTISRPTLSLVVKELLPQMGSSDEIIVVGDGRQEAAERMMAGLDPRVHYYEYGPTKLWGHPQRNMAMRIAKGDYIMSLDDDDKFLPGALNVIKKALLEAPLRPHMFRTRHLNYVLWGCKSIADMNVSTQMVVVPNVPGRLGVWGDRYQGDLDFMLSTAKLYPEGHGAFVWREEITSVHGIAGDRKE